MNFLALVVPVGVRWRGDRGRDRLKIMRVTARGSECSPTPDPVSLDTG